jgi:MoaA/NifB/PqqE/SkfB family radical SAM enzyme
MTDGQSSLTDELLRQATCAVLIDGQVKGTAWLLNHEGLLLTAGHVLGETNPPDKVQVRFPEDLPRDAYKVVWFYQREAGVDFAVLKAAEAPKDRQPLPISLEREPAGQFSLRGYGRSLQDQSCGTGEIIGSFDPQNQSALRLIRLRSPELGEPGYSGGAVFLEGARAAVGVQIEAAIAKTGPGRDTVLAMPLYRIAQIWEPLAILNTGNSMVSVQGAAALTQLLVHDRQPVGKARFVLRKESFGSLVFDKERPSYIPFDADATDIFCSQAESLASIKDRLNDRFEPGSFDTFMQLCQSIELVDQSGKFTGDVVPYAAQRAHLSAPIRVFLSCTNACNFSCRYCLTSSGNPYPGELTTDEVKQLIDQMAEMGCFDLWLGGGEPLVRADLPDIVRHANSRGVTVGISTNAVAATRATVRALRKVKVRCFEVSVEGASEDLYDAIRGESGSYQEALKGIANLSMLGVPIYLRRLCMTSNASETRAFVRLAEELSVERVSMETIMPAGRACDSPDLMLGPEETSALWDDAIALQETTQVSIDIPGQPPAKPRRQKFWDSGNCNCGSLVCYIDSRGNVSPTRFITDPDSTENIRQHDLRLIWNRGASFVGFRTRADSAKCRKCVFADY